MHSVNRRDGRYEMQLPFSAMIALGIVPLLRLGRHSTRPLIITRRRGVLIGSQSVLSAVESRSNRLPRLPRCAAAAGSACHAAAKA
jgi:hypothetical protein